MWNSELEVGSKWLSGSESESVWWVSFEWDSTVCSHRELPFLCDVWKVEEDKAVWFKCWSIIVLTKVEECTLAGGTGLLQYKSVGGR